MNKKLEVTDKSHFQAGMNRRFSDNPEALDLLNKTASKFGEILEWSFFFTPDLWASTKGRHLPTLRYHDQYLRNLQKCMLGLGYGKDELAFWMEVVARGHIKTTMVRLGMLWVATEIVRTGRYTPKDHTEEDMVYITGTDEKCRKKLAWLWYQLQYNQALKGHYGYLLPTRADPETSSSTEKQLKNGMWIAGFGVKGGIRSIHPEFLFVDDPEELAEGGEKKKEKKAERTIWETWSRTIMGTTKPGTRVFYTANYVGTRCLTKKLTKIYPDKYAERPCWNRQPNGQMRSLWPQHFTVGYLEQKKKDIGDAAFSCEMELHPTADTDSPIKEEWIQMYDSSDRKSYPPYWWAQCPIVIFFDPAYTDNADSDYTAIVPIALDLRGSGVGMYRCLPVKRGRWTDHEEILEEVRATYWSFRQAISRLEVYVENAIQSEAKAFIATNRLMNERSTSMTMPLRDWKVRDDGKSKKSRMSKIANVFREGRIWFDSNDPNQQDLIDEMVLFGQEEHDDYADACTGALNVFRVRQVRWRKRVDRSIQPRIKMVRDKMTGLLRRAVA